MQKVNLPDGRTLKIPNDLSAEKRDELANAVKAEYNIDINEGSLGEWLIDKPKSVVRGLSQMIPTGVKGIAGLTLGSDSDIVKGISDYQRYIATESPLASDPKYRDTFGTKLSEGAGSLIGFGGLSYAGRRLAAKGVLSDKAGRFGVPGSLAVPMGMGEQVDRLEQSRALGEESPGFLAEKTAILAGGVIGLSELAPLERLFRGIPKNALKNPTVQQLLNTRLRSAIATGTAEAIQEAGAGVLQNLTAAGLYSDEIPIFDSALEEFTIGGILGASADLLVNSLANRRSISSQQLRDAETKARDNRTSLQSQDKFARAQEQGMVEEYQEPIIKEKPEIDVPAIVDVAPPDLGVIENPDGQFSVVDYNDLENPILSSHATEVDALLEKNNQQTNYERKVLQVQVDNDTYMMGMPDSDSAKTLGRTVLDPNITQINLSTLIGYDSSISEDLKKELNKEKSATYPAQPYRQMLENKRKNLEKTAKYLESKGLDLKSSFSMPEAKKVLKPKDYNLMLESFANHAFTASEKAGEPSIREDKLDVTIKNIKAIAESKNIELDFKDPAVRYAAKQWTGFEDIPKTRNRGAKELFLARIHSLPAFNSKTKFPDFRPRAYTGVDMANFVASAQDIQFTDADLLVAGPESIRNKPENVKQFLNDLIESGRAKKIKNTNKYELTDDFEYTVARRQEGFNETPDEFRARLERDRSLGKNKLSDEAIDSLVASEEVRQEKVLPPKEIEKKLIDFNETIEEGRTNKFAKELRKKLNKVGLRDTGIVVSNDILSTTTLAETETGQIIFDPRKTRETATEGAVEGEYDRDTDIIFLSLNSVNPDGTATDEQILQRLDKILDHEMIHAFRKKDLITEKEYQYLRNEVKRKKVPTEYDASSKNETFYTRSQRINSGMVRQATSEGRAKEEIEEFLVEEAIAEMYRAREFKPVTPKSKGILNRIVEFFKSMGQAMRVSGYRDSSEIFADIERGKVGARERGQIRTLQELDKISMAREQGIVGGLGITPSAVPEEPRGEDKLDTSDPQSIADEWGEGVLITPTVSFNDVKSDTDPITGVTLPLEARQRGGLYNKWELTPEEYEADRKQILDEFYRPTGIGDGIENIKSIEVLKWLSKNGPTEDYRVIANRLLVQQRKLKRIVGIEGYFAIFNDEHGGKQRFIGKGTDYQSFLGVSYAPFLNDGSYNVKDYNPYGDSKLVQQVYLKDTSYTSSPGHNGVSFDTMLHELVHQTTQAATNFYRGSRATEQSKKLVKDLEEVRKELIKEIEKRTDTKGSIVEGQYVNEDAENKLKSEFGQDGAAKIVYAASKIQETLAVGFTNRYAQDFMDSIPYKGTKKTLWDKFTESIRKLLSLPAKTNSLFSEFLRISGKLTNLSNAQLEELNRVGADYDYGPPVASLEMSDPSIESELSDLRRELYDAESLESADRGYVDVEVGNRNMRRVQNIRNKIERLEEQLKREAELKQPVTPEQLPLFSRTQKDEKKIRTIARENRKRLKEEYKNDPDAVDEIIKEFEGEELFSDGSGFIEGITTNRGYMDDIPLSFSSERLSKKVLEDYGYEEIFEGEMSSELRDKDNQQNYYVDLGQNKFRVYFNRYGNKRNQATITNPTLDELMNESWFEKERRSSDIPLFSRGPRDESSGHLADYVPAEYGPPAHQLDIVYGDEKTKDGYYPVSYGFTYPKTSPDYRTREFTVYSTARTPLEQQEEREFINKLMEIRGNPNAEITMYQAAPQRDLREGDLITPFLSEAEALVEDSKVTQQEIREADRARRRQEQIDKKGAVDLQQERLFNQMEGISDILGRPEVTPSTIHTFKLKAGDVRWDGNNGWARWGYFPRIKAVEDLPLFSRAATDTKPPYMDFNRKQIRNFSSNKVGFYDGVEIPLTHVARMRVEDFLKLTTANQEVIDNIITGGPTVALSSEPMGLLPASIRNPDAIFDSEIADTAIIPSLPNLEIRGNGQVISHEGRHRVALIGQGGGRTVPVFINFPEGNVEQNIPNPSGQTLQEQGVTFLRNQEFNNFTVPINRLGEIAPLHRDSAQTKDKLDYAVEIASQPDLLAPSGNIPLFSRQSKTPSIKELPGEVSEYRDNYNITDTELLNAIEATEMSRKSGTRENPGQLDTTIVEIFENNPNLLEASKNFLRKFTNKKGNLIVYRALNIPASMRIKNYGQFPQDIYASATIDHREAKQIASSVEIRSRAKEEAQSEILRFEVPMDRVKAYVPSLIVAGRERLIEMKEQEFIDAGIESEMDEDFNPDEYNDYTREQYIEEYENDLDASIDEAEVLVDLRGIKPTYQYTPGSGITGREPSITRDIPLFSRARRFTGEANTQEKVALQKSTEIIEDFVKKTPRGEIPLYNTNASDVALKAAYDYINDPSAPTINELPNYSRVEKEIPEDLQGVVNRGGYVAPRKPWYERLISDVSDPVTNIRKFFKDTRQNYIDKLDKVEKKIAQGSEEFEEVRLLNNIADTSAIAALRMADKARGIFQGMLTRGFATDVIDGEAALTTTEELEIDTVYNPYIDGDTGTGGLLQITAPLFSDPLVDLEGIFGTYAKLKRVQGFQKQNRQVESPFTQQDLEFINNIEANYQVVVEVYNNYQKWNNKLVDFAQAKGLLNEAQATKWREESTYYPFYRDMVEEEGITAPRIGGGSLPNNPLNLKLKGSEAEINVSPLEAIARNSLSILTASMKNDGATKLIESLAIMGEAEYITPQQLKNKQGAKTIFVFENGFKKHYNIEDPDLFHSIRALGGAEVGFITKLLAMPATLLRDTVTRDPGFIAVNLLRDTLSATVTSGVNLSSPFTGGDGFVPMIDTIKNMFGDMTDLEKFGVIGGYDFANDEGDVVDYMARIRRQQGLTANNGMSAEKAFFYVWDGLGGLTTKSDGATRKGVFDAVYKRMKNTIDERTGEVYTDAAAQSEAAFQALEVINFGRRGLSPMFRVITSAIPFLNARIQGLDVIYRSFRGTYSAQDKLQEGETLDELKNRIMRRTALRGGTIMASTLIYYLLVSDTEEYKEAKRELRDDNWLIPTPFDYTLKVPIPFEIGMMFKALPERFIDLVLGEKVLGLKESVEKDPIESIRRQLGTSANIPFLSGDISIQALKPIFEATINRNSFTGQEIVPYYKLKREPGYQASPQTNELARVIGEALNISPTKIEHVINGYTGTLGGYVLDIVDSLTRTATGSPYIPNNIFSNPTNFAQYPLIKRLVVDNKKMGGLQQQFYELRGEVDRAVTTMNSLKQEKRFDELRAYKSDVKGLMNVKGRVRAMERYLDNWRKRRDRLMRRTDISVMVKAEMIQDLEAERDKRLAFIPELRKKANVPILQGGL